MELPSVAIVMPAYNAAHLLPQTLTAAIEAAKGSPLSERAQVLGQQVGIAVLLLLMSLAFYNDISSRFLN